MTVIAKMQLENIMFFAGSPLAKLTCVCENDLMAAYAKADEDRLFTKYSPWGEMKVAFDFGYPYNGRKFYVIVLCSDERPLCPGAAHVHPVRCHVIHDFGTSKQVEVKHDAWPSSAHNPKPENHPGELDWRMSIDNPPAVAFFEPGKVGYWVAFYEDTKFDKNSALHDAFRTSEDA